MRADSAGMAACNIPIFFLRLTGLCDSRANYTPVVDGALSEGLLVRG